VNVSPPLLRFVLRRHRRALLWVACVPVLIGGVAGLLFEGYASKREAVAKLLESFPFVRKLLDSETLDFFTPAGFFNIAFRHPLTFLSFALVAGIPALTCPAGDRGRGSLDLLLAAPLRRRELVLTLAAFSGCAAVAVGLAPLCGATLGACVAGRLDAAPLGRYLAVAGVAAAFTAALAGVALRIAVAASDAATAIGRFAAFFVVTMLVDALSMLSDAAAWTRWWSLGGYYRSAEIVAGKADFVLSYGVLLGTFVLAVASAARAAERRTRA
jgi:ABC-2 type transport system permease protein